MQCTVLCGIDVKSVDEDADSVTDKLFLCYDQYGQ